MKIRTACLANTQLVVWVTSPLTSVCHALTVPSTLVWDLNACCRSDLGWGFRNGEAKMALLSEWTSALELGLRKQGYSLIPSAKISGQRHL